MHFVVPIYFPEHEFQEFKSFTYPKCEVYIVASGTRIYVNPELGVVPQNLI